MKKIIIFCLITFVVVGSLFAQVESEPDVIATAPQSSFSVVVDAAYYPLSDRIIGESHFSPIIGAYSGLEGRVTGNYFYTIPFSFGDNPLVSNNKLVINPAFEVSPVSLMSILKISFSPIAFLNFTFGGKIGTGWELSPLGIKGIASFNDSSMKYENLTPFKNYYYESWIEALFQFDLAAVIPGEWNHVVLLAFTQLKYTGVSGVKNGTPWLWQASGEKINGLGYYNSIILGYQMPLVLQTIGLQAEFEGYYKEDSFDVLYTGWNPCFMTVSLNPVCILKFTEKHSLTIQACFSSRRCYMEELKDDTHELFLNHSGREWYFNRVAFSYCISL